MSGQARGGRALHCTAAGIRPPATIGQEGLQNRCYGVDGMDGHNVQIDSYAATSASPRRRANRARTSVTYCSASSMGIRWSRSLSVGSLIQPSIGMALSASACQRAEHGVCMGDVPSWKM